MDDKKLCALAAECGLTDPDRGDWMTDFGGSEEAIKSLAAAVERAERERCLYWCSLGSSDGFAEHHIRAGTPAEGPPSVV